MGDRDDRDVQAEIGFHIDRATEENLAKGMAPAEARAEALRRFGNLDQVRRDCLAARHRGVSPFIAWTAVAALAVVSFLLGRVPMNGNSGTAFVHWPTARPAMTYRLGAIVVENHLVTGMEAGSRFYGLRTGLSTFTNWRWRNGTPEVTRDGKAWFELVSAGGVPAATLREEYRAAQGLPEGMYLDGDPALMIFGNPRCPGPSVEALLRNLADGSEVREVCVVPLVPGTTAPPPKGPK